MTQHCHKARLSQRFAAQSRDRPQCLLHSSKSAAWRAADINAPPRPPLRRLRDARREVQLPEMPRRVLLYSLLYARTKRRASPPTVKPKARPKRVAPEKRAGRPPDPRRFRRGAIDAGAIIADQQLRVGQRGVETEPTLRDLLVTIEGSNDPTNALQTARARDSRFADFVDRLLVEVGACAFEDDGSVVFVGAGGEPPAPNAGRPDRPIYK